MGGRSATAPRTLSLGPAVRWVLPLWWLTSRRQWRQHGGALLTGAALGALLVLATITAPPDGRSLYFTVVFGLCFAFVVSAPLILTTETVLSSRRIALLPISPGAAWLIRVLFANSLRSVSAVVTGSWAVAVILAETGQPGVAALRVAQSLALLLLAVSLSELLEDVIRHRRAVVLHQLAFLAAVSLWPIILEFLRTPANFAPPPDWTRGPAAVLLIAGEAPSALLLAANAALLLLAAGLIRIDGWFLERQAPRAVPPPTGTRWTATVARVLASARGRSSPLYKELLVPLRFLFLRMSLFFVALTAAAAFTTGIPLLLLGIVFWWQPLSTNALGPDVPDGRLRYALLGWPDRRVLRTRLLASVLLTAVTVSVVAAPLAVAGWIEPPRWGPPTRLVYPMVLAYALSLMALWAVAGDRYSRRFADPLEMHTLLPERRRSGGATALLWIGGLWAAVGFAALLILGLAAGLVTLLAPGDLNLPRAAAVVGVAALANATAYQLHSRPRRERQPR